MIGKVASWNLCAVYVLVIVLAFTGNVDGDNASEYDTTGDVERFSFEFRDTGDYDFSLEKTSGHSNIDITRAESYESGDDVMFTLRVSGNIIESSYNDSTLYSYCIGVMLDDWKWNKEYSAYGEFEYEAYALYFIYTAGYPIGIYYDGVVSMYNYENVHSLSEGSDFSLSTYGDEISFTISKDSFSYGSKWEIYGFAWETEIPDYEDYENTDQYNFDFTFHLDLVGEGGADCPFSPVAQYKQLSGASSSSDNKGEDSDLLTYGAVAGGAVVTAAVAIVVVKALAGSAVAAKGGTKAGAKGADRVYDSYRTGKGRPSGSHQSGHPSHGHQAGKGRPSGSHHSGHPSSGHQAGEGHLSPRTEGNLSMRGHDPSAYGHLASQPLPPLDPAQIAEVGRNVTDFIGDSLLKCLKQAFSNYIESEIRRVVLQQLSKRLEIVRNNVELIQTADEIYFYINEILLANNINQAAISVCSLSAENILHRLRARIFVDGEKELRLCSACGDNLVFVKKYDRWWCDKCQLYDGDGGNEPRNKKDRKNCSHCGNSLDHVEKYDRWWCDNCQQYDPGAVPKQKTKDKHECSSCGHGLVHVEKYDRWWCDLCQQYDRGAALGQPVKDKNKCSSCGHGLVYVEKYDRWWCERCQQYDRDTTPKEPKEDKNKCSACGYGLVYVDKYDRWWCDGCRQYDGKEIRKDKKKNKRKPRIVGDVDDSLDLGELESKMSDLDAYEIDFDGL